MNWFDLRHALIREKIIMYIYQEHKVMRPFLG